MLSMSGQAALGGGPEDLPPEARDALRTAAAQDPAALYVVVYAGVKPSGGYAVSIDSMRLEGPADRQTLVVSTSETGPGRAGVTALTYPYTIARVLSPPIEPQAVQFSGQQ